MSAFDQVTLPARTNRLFALFCAGEEQPSNVFNLDSTSLNEVLRTMFNDNYPAKGRACKKYKPKEEPQKPHGRILLACGSDRNRLRIVVTP
jgi:hypothetical protein